MNNLDLYCVTNKKLEFLENTDLKLAAVGKEKFSNRYLRCDNKINIYEKEKHYSELTFHYWYWKNCLMKEKKDWIGFCQKRRFWIKPEKNKNIININNLNNFLIDKIDNSLESYESIICDPIKVSGAKKIKIIKRGWRNLINDPSIIFMNKKETISVISLSSLPIPAIDKASNLHFVNDTNSFSKILKKLTEMPVDKVINNDSSNYLYLNDELSLWQDFLNK